MINNYIGTDPTGTRRFGNGLDGVLLGDATASNLLRDNLILFNARDGISLENADNNDILSNTSNLNGRDGLRVGCPVQGELHQGKHHARERGVGR